jgi:hypothetical protein
MAPRSSSTRAFSAGYGASLQSQLTENRMSRETLSLIGIAAGA